jgi:hypothetical protein
LLPKLLRKHFRKNNWNWCRPFLLIESDLVFDSALPADMHYSDRIAAADLKPRLDGSTVTINTDDRVDAFHTDTSNASTQKKFKAVNIYSLSLFSWHKIAHMLNRYFMAGMRFFAKNLHKAAGRQMDSLIDMISFGICPAIVLFEGLFNSTAFSILLYKLFMIMAAFNLGPYIVHCMRNRIIWVAVINQTTKDTPYDCRSRFC